MSDEIKLAIAPRLRGMKVGEFQAYPIERKYVVRTIANRINQEFRERGRFWATRTTQNTITVMRTK